jgi:hypothetical protein
MGAPEPAAPAPAFLGLLLLLVSSAHNPLNLQAIYSIIIWYILGPHYTRRKQDCIIKSGTQVEGVSKAISNYGPHSKIQFRIRLKSPAHTAEPLGMLK